MIFISVFGETLEASILEKGTLIKLQNSHYLQLKLLSGKNVRAWVSMDFTQDKFSAPIAI